MIDLDIPLYLHRGAVNHGLDLVWDRLTSFEPLLLLLPGVWSSMANMYVLIFVPLTNSISFIHSPFPALYTPRIWLCSGRTRDVLNMSVTDENSKFIPPYAGFFDSRRKYSPEPCKCPYIFSAVQRVFLASPYIAQSSDSGLRPGVQS